jgi:4-hydroxybenzoate polyprenyltransferase
MSVSLTKPVSPAAANISDYVHLARPDHWFKNVFMFPGMLMAYMYYRKGFDGSLILDLVLSVVSTCFIASANYVINEWLDAEFDRHHPVKKLRPSVVKNLNPKIIYAQYVVLAALGLGIAYRFGMYYFLVALLLLVMGVLYNVRPFRTKERAYIDVLSESVNNPIRFMLGWLAVAPFILPPSSIIVAYWMGGAFLMGCKRLAEYRFINDKATAGLYRKSFQRYTQTSLIISIFFYALTSTFFLGIFLIKHRIELLLTFPLFALLFSWYLTITFRPNSAAQGLEKLYTNWKYMIFIVLFFIFAMSLLVIDIPWLHWFLRNNFG